MRDRDDYGLPKH